MPVHVASTLAILSLTDRCAPNGDEAMGQIELFSLLYATTSGAVFASMMAYLAAQYNDVALFHFWKRLTKANISDFAITPARLSARRRFGRSRGCHVWCAILGRCRPWALVLADAQQLSIQSARGVARHHSLYLLVNYLRRYLELPEGEIADGFLTEDVLAFWFQDSRHVPKAATERHRFWFRGGGALDTIIQDRYTPLISGQQNSSKH